MTISFITTCHHCLVHHLFDFIMSKEITVKCHKCGQKRKASSGSFFVWLKHAKYKMVMQKNENGKYYCCNGYGCDYSKSKAKVSDCG